MKLEYLVITTIFVITIIICLVFLFYKYKISLEYKIKKLIIQNHLYDDDMSAEIDYAVKNNQIIIRFKKNGYIYTGKANQFSNHFQAILDLPLEDINNNMTYCEYIFDLFPDKRLDFSTREVINNTIRLTEKISWEFSKPCHTIICGATNSGKTYLATMLILDYLKIKGKGGGCDIYICDPKSADLSIICQIIDSKKYAKVQNLATSENESCLESLMYIKIKNLDHGIS